LGATSKEAPQPSVPYIPLPTVAGDSSWHKAMSQEGLRLKIHMGGNASNLTVDLDDLMLTDAPKLPPNFTMPKLPIFYGKTNPNTHLRQ
ncbi:hypothetical protein K8353_48125, partial [Burkholderia contaminans]|nr:hypothetical protein [Burkholderia contaminans]